MHEMMRHPPSSSKEARMKKSLLAIAMAFACTNAYSDSGVSETGLRYNEINVGYQSISNSDIRMNGYAIAGSTLFDKNVIIDASYSDLSKNTVKSSSSTVNIGYRLGVAQNADVYAKLGYISTTGKGGAPSDSSYLLTGGARALLTPEVELAGYLSYSGLDNASVYYGGSLGYHLTENLSLRGQLRADNAAKSNTVYILSVGYNY